MQDAMQDARLATGGCRAAGRRRRRAGTWLAAVVAAVLVLATLMPGAAFADHGTWTVHSYVLTDPSPSTYSAYARVNASDRYDYAMVEFRLDLASTGRDLITVSATCGAVNEGCGLVRTPSRSWSQGGSNKRAWAVLCARDGSHRISGTSWPYPEDCGRNGMLVHRHTSAPFN